MLEKIDFVKTFKVLTGLKDEDLPFPWQENLFKAFSQGNVPSSCNIPTGLGKTMVIPIWLIALACGSDIPRKLVYVVNRRTIVDQATDLVVSINKKIKNSEKDTTCFLNNMARSLKNMNCFDDDEEILAISTLRGELADNKEWKKNPTKPCIIIGTVDMIGSKLLFSGYGDTRRTRPLHAGILGCDSLFIHDEAHLTPAFGKLLRSIQQSQSYHSTAHDNLSIIPDISVMELSATPGISDIKSISLTDQERSHPVVRKRLEAKKALIFHEIEKKGKPLQEEIVKQALEKRESNAKILIFVRDPKDAQKISGGIKKGWVEAIIQDFKDRKPEGLISSTEKKNIDKDIGNRVSTLTGRIRGYERDLLLEKPGMQPFLGKKTIEKTHYFVATSAAEVGMDLHADHSICDLSTLDSMIQRLGRVNRFGECGCSFIDIVYEKEILDLEEKWNIKKGKAIKDFNESFHMEFRKLEKKKSRSEEKIMKEKEKLEEARTQKAKDKVVEKVRQLEMDLSDISEKLENINKTKEDDLIKHLRESKTEFIKNDPIQWPRFKTYQILLKNRDNMSLDKIKMILEGEASEEAFSADVEKMELTEILLDLWSQTSLQDHPARPSPESWLHGIIDEYPHTYIAWREEVEKIAPLSNKDIESWFKYHPILTKERLQIPTFEIKNTGSDNRSTLLKLFDKQKSELPVIIASSKGSYERYFFKDIVDNPLDHPLEYATIIFPSSLGGLDESGFFDPTKRKDDIDVANEDITRVILKRHNDDWSFYSYDDNNSMEGIEWKSLKDSLLQIENKYSKKTVHKLQTIKIDELSEDDEIIEEWLVLLKHQKKKNDSNGKYPTVTEHNHEVLEIINKFNTSLQIDKTISNALSIAAKHHDDGKINEIWQIAAGHDNAEEITPFAKGNVDWRKLGGYRHEVGSLIDLHDNRNILENEEKDLILHLIAVHHGWGRPHFEEQAFPPATEQTIMKDIIYETMMNYSRLQDRFGWWKLAYLESLLRQADAIASYEDPDTGDEI